MTVVATDDASTRLKSRILLSSEIPRWDDFVLSNKGHIFQTHEWGQISRALGWEPRHLVWEDETGQWHATATVLQRFRLGGILAMQYVSRGPVVSRDCIAGWGNIAKGLADFAKEKGALLCRINPLSYKREEIERTLLQNRWEHATSREMHVRTFRLSLPDQEQILWAGLEYRTQKAIKKAQRMGVEITKESEQAGLDEFTDLYVATAERLGISHHRPDFLQSVWNCLAPKGWAHLFMARSNGKALSGLFLLRYGTVLEEMWIGWDKTMKEMRPNQLLHWEILCWCLKNGIQTYDFGGVPPQSDAAHGVYFYKAGFGAALVDLAGEYDYYPTRWGRLVWSRMRPMLMKFR